jgi:hypothetical protein
METNKNTDAGLTVTPNLAADLREMLANWNKIEAAARTRYPNASEKEIYRLTSGAMNHSLGLT